MQGGVEGMILLSLFDKQLDGMLAAPNASTEAVAATGRLRMAAVVREAEKMALEQLKYQVLLVSSSHDGGGAVLDDEPCMGDLMWDPSMADMDPRVTDDSEDDGGSSEDSDEDEDEGSDDFENEQDDEDEDEDEEEEGGEDRNGVEASASQEQAPETGSRKRGRGSGEGVPSADEAALLSASVLPATEKRGRRSSTVSLRTGDPVRKRLKF